MTRILTIIALLFATAMAAGSYRYEPSASKLINDAKKLIEKKNINARLSSWRKRRKMKLIMPIFLIIWGSRIAKSAIMRKVKSIIRKRFHSTRP